MSRSKTIKSVCLLVIAAFLLPLFLKGYFSGSGVPDLARKIHCETRMRLIAQAIYAYGENHRDIPQKNGEFCPETLICQNSKSVENCVALTNTRCALRPSNGSAWDGLSWCPEISEFQSKTFVPGHPESSSKVFVLLCHEPGSLHRINAKWYAPILLSNGIACSPTVELDEYRRWFNQEFRRGNVGIPTFVSDQVTLSPW